MKMSDYVVVPRAELEALKEGIHRRYDTTRRDVLNTLDDWMTRSIPVDLSPEGEEPVIGVTLSTFSDMQRRIAAAETMKQRVIAEIAALKLENYEGQNYALRSTEPEMVDKDTDYDRVPFFSESFLYPLLGKESACSLLRNIDNIFDAIGVERERLHAAMRKEGKNRHIHVGKVEITGVTKREEAILVLRRIKKVVFDLITPDREGKDRFNPHLKITPEPSWKQPDKVYLFFKVIDQEMANEIAQAVKNDLGAEAEVERMLMSSYERYVFDNDREERLTDEGT